MTIVTLNIWGGIKNKELLSFFEKHRDIDIFLLQEVFYNATERTMRGFGLDDQKDAPRIFFDIEAILTKHTGLFAAAETEEWGLAAFIKKDIPILEIGDIFVHRWKDALEGKDGTTLGKNLQYIIIRYKNNELTICNFHGLWNGKGKTDTDDRLKQSDNIVRFLATQQNPIVLAGDFNLNPDTESLKKLEPGMRNLIKEYGITSTRTSFYEKENKFADYVLISEGIAVQDFKVLPDEVSDHAALYLEI